jgi:hypothetical protein
MPKRITIAVDQDGTAEWTRAKELDGLFGGAGVMKRVTDIQKLDNSSKFYIRWMLGPYAGKAHDLEKHIAVFGGILDGHYGGPGVSDRTGTLMFPSYEDAVAYEIKCLNEMRRAGVTFDAEAETVAETGTEETTGTAV